MKVLILAAGYATRLWPLTLDRPKPLLPIKEKPIIEYSIEKISGIKRLDTIYIVTNTKFVTNFVEWSKGCKINKEIKVIDDEMETVDEKRGSIGDILYSIEAENIKDDLLVIAGDNLFNFSLDAFIKFSLSNTHNVTIGLFDVKDTELCKQYGIVTIDKDKKITDFVEKPKDPPSTLAAMCFYFFPAKKLNLIKQYRDEGHPLDLAGNFIAWLSKKELVYGYPFEGIWLDIGDKESLKYAQENYKE